MMSSPHRPIFAAPIVIVALAVVVGTAGTAHAIDLGGGTIDIELQLPDGDGGFELKNVEDIEEFFNTAHCICSAEVFAIELTLENAPAALASEAVEIWVGQNCNDIELRDDNCLLIDTIEDVETLRTPTTRTIAVRELVDPLDTGICREETFTPLVWALIDDEGDGIYENEFSLQISVDMQQPPLPDEIEVTGGERAIVVNWEIPDSRADDIEFFQVLCLRVDDDTTPIKSDPDAKYETSLALCKDPGDLVTPPIPYADLTGGGDPPDAGVAVVDGGMPIDAGTPSSTLPALLQSIDESVICGTASGTETGIRVGGLENKVEYYVVLVVTDRAQNALAIDLGKVTPKQAIDFWEDYSKSGSAEGGFCFVATASYGNYDHPYVLVLRDFRDGTLARFALGRRIISWYYENSPALAGFIDRHPIAKATSAVLLFPLVVFAGIWEYTGLLAKLALVLAFFLFRRLRRRDLLAQVDRRDSRRRAGSGKLKLAIAAGAGVLILSLSSIASAQAYWDELNDDVPEATGPPVPHWNFEFKLGPYRPDVDSEFGGDGPFERMYGPKHFLMSKMALEYFFVHPEGQLGIAGSIGFMSKTAQAYQVDDIGNVAVNPNGKPLRSDGDTNSFRLLPTSISAVYRYTALDDRFRIPIVPYGRLGLAYYIWWVKAPNGDIAEAPTDDCLAPDTPGATCDGDKALGGSLGFLATVGLAVRLERLDPDARLSLRNELGISHAGVFIEGTVAEVDGFGSSKKLSVGDVTFFAGINFEY